MLLKMSTSPITDNALYNAAATLFIKDSLNFPMILETLKPGLNRLQKSKEKTYTHVEKRVILTQEDDKHHTQIDEICCKWK